MREIIEYLNHKPGLRGKILDRGELKRVAVACGLSPQQTRVQLREMGFVLTENDHGIAIWIKPDDDDEIYSHGKQRYN
ncbi:MAG TPA: hypothetical protein PKK11_02140 [Methanothrix sp.]|nr:hypothetical protein [Methanothrix sp.]